MRLLAKLWCPACLRCRLNPGHWVTKWMGAC
jgi:hypothetical protein